VLYARGAVSLGSDAIAMTTPVRLAPEVATALRDGRPIVALESSVLAQGLPAPANREAARRMMAAVRAHGATPAVTAVVQGVPTVGLRDDELERFLRRDGIRKVSARDIPLAMASKVDGATTVAATLAIAAAVGVKVFATGGIGGVHREPPYDESADLLELARAPMVVICAGAKSILDLEATVERLETLGVPLRGYRTGELPGFFTTGSGIAVSARVERAAEVAAVYRAHRALGRQQAVLVVQSPPAELALSRDEVDAAVSAALERARSEGIRGGAVTPFLLAEMERTTGGRSIGANLALLERNAALAAEIAGELSE
jgi:pseudouridylate synthase